MDLTATVRRPVALAQVLEAERDVLKMLLATDSLPDLVVVDGRKHERGIQVAPGHPMTAAELATVMVGEAITPGPDGVSGARFFELDVTGFEERTGIMFFDFHYDGGEDEENLPVQASVSPTRTCVGVVVAAGFALAAAIEGRGEFIDETRMLQPPVDDPRLFIEQTRLREAGNDFATQCERFLRQFPTLAGWPPDRCIPRN
ncbi:hypothetical protein [Actinomadura meyerae]|uniref:hypothetical protein n=1 Tax=Actinomadura meyerae TaxID=240840 RepID=UPI001177ABB8|nr:hypothetical protein [Actinomadura meyerae]